MGRAAARRHRTATIGARSARWRQLQFQLQSLSARIAKEIQKEMAERRWECAARLRGQQESAGRKKNPRKVFRRRRPPPEPPHRAGDRRPCGARRPTPKPRPKDCPSWQRLREGRIPWRARRLRQSGLRRPRRRKELHEAWEQARTSAIARRRNWLRLESGAPPVGMAGPCAKRSSRQRGCARIPTKQSRP